MKKGAVVFSVLVAVSVMFTASTAMGECREGKVEWTIVNPAGKVIVICLPEHVTGIGGPNDIAIPASCPCFSQEDIQLYYNKMPDLACKFFEGTTDGSKDPCSYVYCIDGIKIYAMEGPDHGYEQYCETRISTRLRVNQCTGPSSQGSVPIGAEEADACVAILKSFLPSGDDCSDPYELNPDPDEPLVSFVFQLDSTSAGDDYNIEDRGHGLPDVVFRVNAISGIEKKPQAKITVTPLGWDAVVYVATDCRDVEGSLITAMDKGGIDGSETVEFTVFMDTTYYVIVDGTVGENEHGLFALEGGIGVDGPPGPIIILP